MGDGSVALDRTWSSSSISSGVMFSRSVTIVKSITIVLVAFMQMHCCFKHNGYVECEKCSGVPGSVRRGRVLKHKAAVPAFACLCTESEGLRVCQVWAEWETGSRLWGILPQQTSIITRSRDLLGDRNVFFNNSKSWTLSLSPHSRSYRQLSDTCATNAYLRHSTCYIYKKETCIKCTVYHSHKKPLGHKRRMCERTSQSF